MRRTTRRRTRINRYGSLQSVGGRGTVGFCVWGYGRYCKKRRRTMASRYGRCGGGRGTVGGRYGEDGILLGEYYKWWIRHVCGRKKRY